jgi:hypothetical protein
MNEPKKSILTRVGTPSVITTSPQVKRDVVLTVGKSSLTSRKPRPRDKVKDGCANYTLRNLPKASKVRYDDIIAAGLFRESYTQFMLDAIEEKLKKMERKIQKEATK